MKHITKVLIVCLLFFSCKAQETPTQFTEEALNDIFVTTEGERVTFKEILDSHRGSTLVIDVWASWCRDCLNGMPNVKALQKEYDDVTYVFLSLDKNEEAWKRGIEKYNVQGNHYFMQSGWKGDFGNFIELDWIPRYMVIDTEGNIKLFKAVKADDKRIIENL